VARASNPAGTTAMWVRDRLGGLRDDEDFAGGWYPRDGRPEISPAQLATVSVLQFLLDLSGRDAAEAVRSRIDFEYALGLDLDDPGFHHGVLGDFRDRLLEDGWADRLLDLALARLKEARLVRERTTWRTDSTHVLAAVRDLTAWNWSPKRCARPWKSSPAPAGSLSNLLCEPRQLLSVCYFRG
jgi:transposase